MSQKRAERFRTIKGTFDILPQASTADGNSVAGSAAWREVEAAVRRVMEAFGVREIRTPILEPTELIARGIGAGTDIVSKEMFAFERGDTSYVLRPEVTAPVMRSYLQHSLGQERAVQKLYYIGPCFRAERPQKGRYRQFHQFGVEYIGTDSVLADAEVISLMVEVYNTLGITGTRLRVNTLGRADTRPVYRNALISYFEPHAEELSDTSRARLRENPLRILDTKAPHERELLHAAPRLIDYISDESRDRYEKLLGLLDALGISYVEDPFLVRGLDYYGETAFEFESDVLGGSQNALAGGGRYDLLATEIGSPSPVPAVGFAAGMERLFLALEASGATPPGDRATDVFVVLVDEADGAAASALVQDMRRSGVTAELDLSGRSVKAQMREANRTDSRFVLVYGESERLTGTGNLRRMSTGEELEARLTGEDIRRIVVAQD